MPTLSEIFTRHQQRLAEALGATPEPARAAMELRRFLDMAGLLYLESEELAPAQRRLLPFVLDMLKSAAALPAVGARADLWKREAPPASRHKPWISKAWLWRGLQLAAAGLLAIFLLLGLNGVELLLLALVIGIEWQRGEEAAPKPAAKTEERLSVQLETQELLRQLADVLLTADKLLAQAPALQPERNSGDGLEQFPDVLELMQDLLEARLAGDGSYALRKAKTVPALLELHGIRLESYSGDNAQLFEFLPSLAEDDSEYKTLCPALLRGTQLVSRGRVLEPPAQ
jgi:hypothetical protein